MIEMVINLFLAFIMALSFLTFIPMPMIQWTDKRIQLMPLTFPLVGAIIGGIGCALFYVLYVSGLTSLLKAILLLLYYLFITGGLHMDGLMDTADAYFSRRDKDKKLSIMKDSNIGAFAAMSIISLLMLKFAFIYEIFSKTSNLYLAVLFIPVLSRTLQTSMLYMFPFAKDDGLAKMYGESLRIQKLMYFYILYMALAIGLMALFGTKVIWLSILPVAYYVFYYFSSKKNFGGITGDILGAFVELSELIMFGVLAFIY